MWSPSNAVPVRLLAGAAGALLAVGVVVAAPVAHADSLPTPASPVNPVTVSADGLPTAQIDGVGWAQTVVGTTVYVGGAFTSARPAGAPAGTGEVPRHSLLAYDITTGVLVDSFAHDLNGQVLAVTASPDGSRLYVGGDFTTVDGQPRNRVAAFDLPSGALDTAWHPSVNSQVRAIAATGSTVYVGGSITAVGGVSRTRLAAVTAADGTLLPWAPQPGTGPTDGNRDGNTTTSDQVLALVLTSGGSQVVAAGRFDSLNGVKATGVGALDAVSGATRPYAVNQLLLNQGINSAVYSLFTDGTVVIGSGYDYYGPGNLEGSFTVTADTGRVLAINDCHGDTYGTYAMGGVVYFASHEHDCSNIGGFPEQQPRQNRFATAQTLAPTGTVGQFNLRSDAFFGKPAPTELDWFPIMKAGTVTGQDQAGWSVTGNGRYLAYAGEFGSVNGVGQQGLVRYALPSIAPNKVGPTFGGFTLTVDQPTPGTARLQWHASSDPDNQTLTYSVYRDSAASTPLLTTTQRSTWYDRPAMSFTDTAAQPGSTFRVVATDPFGNRATTDWTPISPTLAPTSRAYEDAVLSDGAVELWSLGDPAGSPVAAGQRNVAPLLLGAGVTAGVPGGLAGDTDTAFSFDGTAAGILDLPFKFPAPETTTHELWFSTTASTPGELIGFGDAENTDSAVTDRTVVMGADGKLTFSVLVAGVAKTVTTAAAVNDGRWHHLAAELSPAGMFLYLDGALAGARYDTPAGLTLTGYLRVGGDAGRYFDGKLDEVALYTTAPSTSRIQAHYAAGAGVSANAAPVASFGATGTGLAAAFDGSASADPDGTVASYAWSFGDGATGTGATPAHTYAAAGTYAVSLTVTDDKGATGSLSRLVTVTAPDVPPTAAFTPTATGLSLAVDGSASADPDGTVASWAWSFGDGGTATGRTATHAYASAGSYPVTLTVTDDRGATASTSRVVAVTAPPATTVLAGDAFNRTVTGGLGSADTGGLWTAGPGPASRLSVAPGTALLALPTAGNNTGGWLAGSATTADLRTTVALSAAPTGSGIAASVVGRRVGSDTAEYRARLRFLATGAVAVGIVRITPTVTTETLVGAEVTLPATTYAPGQVLAVHLAVTGTGPTTLAATVWPQGAAEPAAPTLTRTDATPELQQPGGYGLAAYRSASATTAVTVRFGPLQVTGPGAPATNAAPTASFTATPTGLAVAVDGSASSDPDGTVTSWAWAFGDGGTATGRTATHSYGAAGSYPVTLTVTDDGGSTGTRTSTVVVTAPGQPPTAKDTFARTVSGGWGTADLGGAWTASAGPTRESVGPGYGEMRLDAAGQNTGAYLGTVAQTRTDLQTTVAPTTAATGSGTYVYLSGRRVAGQGEYRVRLRLLPNGQVALALSRLTGTTESFPGGETTVNGLTWAVGTPLAVDLQVLGTGTTTVRVTLWTAGTPQPATATRTWTDTTAALQAAGAVGLAVYRPGDSTAATAVRFGPLTVTAPA